MLLRFLYSGESSIQINITFPQILKCVSCRLLHVRWPGNTTLFSKKKILKLSKIFKQSLQLYKSYKFQIKLIFFWVFITCVWLAKATAEAAISDGRNLRNGSQSNIVTSDRNWKKLMKSASVEMAKDTTQHRYCTKEYILF